MDHENEIIELKLAVAKLEAQIGRARWWNIATGISAIIGATLAGFTLWALLSRVAETSQIIS